MNGDGRIQPTLRDRILGGLWGAVVGDALGVPVEFKSREAIRTNPVTDLRGHGTHNQPLGTWSDDSSLMLCTVDTLLRHEFDAEDLGKRFADWHHSGLWTPHGKVFDIGIATRAALARLTSGAHAEFAGGADEYSNGNGSLMRILPISLRFSHAPVAQLLDRTHRASAITHRHPRSQMSCGFYSLVVRALLAGLAPHEAFARALDSFRLFYEPDPYWGAEIDNFRVLDGKLAERAESDISSSGYVVDTLTASLWCLLRTSSYPECVLKAVNLGSDTDTTGCVAGGLAGVCYGLAAVQNEWRYAMARHDDIESLFERFAKIL